MRTPSEIYSDVHELVHEEMRATVHYRETRSSKSSRLIVSIRAALLPLLREAASLRDIDLLLNIERAFMELELEHIAHARKNISSLSTGIQQIDAAVTMLGYVRKPDKYQEIATYYTLSQDLLPHSNLPKDAAHKFFGSHRTRLGNAETGPLEKEQTALLDARSRNVRLARELYIELQRHALAASEIRESAKPYKPERKLRLAA